MRERHLVVRAPLQKVFPRLHFGVSGVGLFLRSSSTVTIAVSSSSRHRAFPFGHRRRRFSATDPAISAGPSLGTSMRHPAGLTLAVLAAAVPTAAAQRPTPARSTDTLPTIAERTKGADRRDGFVPAFLERTSGSLWLEFPKNGTRLLKCVSLAAGLGSNPIGLDRGADRGCSIARLQPAGRRLLVVLENWNYRSTYTENPAHARSVAASFAPSTVAALPVIAAEGDRVLVDATSYVLHDWWDVT